MHLETDRLILRNFSPEDWRDLYEYLSKDEVVKYEPYGVLNEEECRNEASWKLMERMLMRREGHYKKPAFFRKSPDGKPLWHDAYEYAILAEEWSSTVNS